MAETRDVSVSTSADTADTPADPAGDSTDTTDDSDDNSHDARSGVDAAQSPFWRRSASVAYDVYRDFVDNRGSGLSAEVAFFAILSVVPALLVLASLLGFLSDSLRESAQRQINDFLNTVLTSEADAIVNAITGLFDRQSGGLLTFATIAAIYSVSRSFQALIRALNLAYDVEDPRGWITTRAVGMLMAIGTIVLVCAILAVIVVLPTIADSFNVLGLRITASYVATPAGFAAAVLWIMTIYHYAPYHRTRWRADFWGALVCALLWILFSIGFRIYLALTVDSNQILAALGGVLVALFWLYLMVIAIFIGAELNSVLWRHGLARISVSASGGFLTRPRRTQTFGLGPQHSLPTKEELKARWEAGIEGLRRGSGDGNDTDGDAQDADDGRPLDERRPS